MNPPNIGQAVVEAWLQMLRETPEPFDFFLWGDDGMTYRERLDRQPKNCYGHLIPRIVTVRRNLRRLKAGG